MDPLHNSLPPYALRVIAEALAYAGTERPLLLGESPSKSALKALSAYIKSHNPKASYKSHSFEKLETLIQLPERTKQLINHRRAFGTKLADYETCINMTLLNK